MTWESLRARELPFPASWLKILETIIKPDDGEAEDPPLDNTLQLCAFSSFVDLIRSTELPPDQLDAINAAIRDGVEQLKVSHEELRDTLLESVTGHGDPLFISLQRFLHRSAKELDWAEAGEFIFHLATLDRLQELVVTTKLRTSEAEPIRWCASKTVRFLADPELFDAKGRMLALISFLDDKVSRNEAEKARKN